MGSTNAFLKFILQGPANDGFLRIFYYGDTKCLSSFPLFLPWFTIEHNMDLLLILSEPRTSSDFTIHCRSHPPGPSLSSCCRRTLTDRGALVRNFFHFNGSSIFYLRITKISPKVLKSPISNVRPCGNLGDSCCTLLRKVPGCRLFKICLTANSWS